MGVLPAEAGHDLGRAVGMRNILVHQYLTIDHEIVRTAAEAAPALFAEFRRSVAAWLTSRS